MELNKKFIAVTFYVFEVFSCHGVKKNDGKILTVQMNFEKYWNILLSSLSVLTLPVMRLFCIVITKYWESTITKSEIWAAEDHELKVKHVSTRVIRLDFFYWGANGYHLFSQMLIVNVNFTAHRIEG